MNRAAPATLDALLLASTLPRQEAVRLAAHVLGRDRTWVLAHGDAPVADLDEATLVDHLQRRARGEPLAYLVGAREFHGRVFRVDRRVLIPRPETELLVDLALARRTDGDARVLDAGTGSGAIAITLALERPRWSVCATDVSRDALTVATGNAAALGASVRFVAGDWYGALADRETFDLIVSNPPYVAAGDRHLDEGDLRFEPRRALTDGADGLAALRAVVSGAAARLVPGGGLLVEHGHDQAAAVRALFGLHGFVAIASAPDLAGIERVTHGTRR